MSTKAEQGWAYPDLQIHEDLRFQRADWRAQRIAWAVFLLLALLGLAGVFGPGPLSHHGAESADGGLRLDYLRFARQGAQADLALRIDPALVAPDGRIDVLLPSAYFDDFELRQIVPEPVAVESAGQELRFTFAAPDPTSPLRVRFVLQADGMGPRRASARAGSATVDFWQWLWP